MRAALPNGDKSNPQPEIVERPDPQAGSGEIVIAVRAAALNRADLLQIRGQYPAPKGESDVLGLESAGVVESVGEGVTNFQPGQRVMALLAGGGQAEKVAAPVGQVMPLPENLSFAEGAALPEACMTAWTNLAAEGDLKEGEWVLIGAAASGIGTMTAQIAREMGGNTIAAGRDLARLEPLKALGAKATVEFGPELGKKMLELTGGRGVNLVFDMAGGVNFASYIEGLADRGRIVLVGLMAGPKAEINLGLVLRKRAKIVGSTLRGRTRAEKTGLVAGFWNFGEARLADGRIKPIVDRTFAFGAIGDAYAYLEKEKVLGKVILTMGG